MSTPPEQFKLRDAASYDEVAANFDYWTERVTSPLADRLVELAALRSGHRVLDLGTGSGVAALASASRVSPRGKIVGIDLSAGMLALARTKARSRDLEYLTEFLQMDAEHLQFADAGFDTVTSLFALLHFPDPLQSLREMRRVLKPGGRAVVGIGASPTLSLRGLAAVFSRIVERRRVLVAPGYLDRLVKQHLPQEAEHEAHSSARQPLTKLFRLAGFRAIQSEWRGHTHRIASAEEFWDLQATFSSVVRKRLSSASHDDVRRIRGEFIAGCDRVLAAGGRLVYRNAALFVWGVRPDAP